MYYDTLPRVTKKFWNLAYCDEIECAVDREGLMFLFAYEEIKHLLKAHMRGPEGWWWNCTHDRYIAEWYDEDLRLVAVNPQFVYAHFQEILT
jgi:hypothetical protein